ncbi:MAG: flagellar hook-associated protein FlgK [Planctomycetota bacterium]|jgi:flagellar hook-associated protein FlgK
MQNFSIGLSGLSAAQNALDIIGNNVANAATEGYHRQRVELAPAYMSQVGEVLLGGGVDMTGITRLIDTLLEREILHQQSSLGQVSCEFDTLRTVENAFAELSANGGLGAVIDEFFNALQDLSAHPGEIIWQSQAMTAATTLAGQFRRLEKLLTDLETQIVLEMQSGIETINTLINQIAELNGNIARMEISGAQTSNLRDQRDLLVSNLSELVGVETIAREYGVVDVTVAGIPVVTGASVTELEAGFREDGSLGISVLGGYSYTTDIQGGRLGAMVALRNDVLVHIHDDLNDLAGAIIQQINQFHVQGVGSEGAFTQLTGWIMPSENLSDFNPPVTDGAIYIRVTNTSTGEVTRNEININASTDTLSSIAAAISGITGLSASVNSSRLNISADTNYEVDFLPAILPTPTAATLTGGTPPAISVSGIHTGSVNDTLRFTVSGAGSVGNGSLQLEVRDGGGAGDVIAILNIGQGYAAGDPLDLGNGVSISLSAGDFGAGDSFDVDVFADTDTSRVLAAVGLNTFFSGNSARDMAVCSDIANSPGRIATALGADMADNYNALRLAASRDQSVSALNAMTPVEFYRRLITDIGQQLSIKQMNKENLEVIIQNLSSQRDDLSGVNINDEAAQMLVFEQMFQAMAKYLNMVHSSLMTVMEIL